MSAGYVAEVAKKGFGEGTNELYDKARLGYTSPVISYIREHVTNREPLTIVEIGSGTGLFTRSLLSQPSFSSVKQYIGVEPSAGMRNFFIKSTVETELGKRAGVTVREGTFDNTGLEDGIADMIVIAQAFHWCANSIHEAAAKEFHRILKPGGVVVMVWNREDGDKAAWVAELRDLVESYADPDSLSHRTGQWKKYFTTSTYPQLFEPPTQIEGFDFVLPANLDITAERVLSKSPVTVQSEEVKKEVVEKVKEIIERGDGLVAMSGEEGKGLFEYPYKTLVVVSRRKDA